MSNQRYRRLLTQAALPALLALAAPAVVAQTTTPAQGLHQSASRNAMRPAAPRMPAAAPKTAAQAGKTSAQAAKPAPAAITKPIPADFIVAVVNTEPITNNDVRAAMARAERDMAQSGTAPPADLAHVVLEQLITERAELQYAREQGISVGADALKQAELTVARQNGLDSLDQLRAQMKTEGIPFASFESDLRNQVMLQELRAREIEPKVHVSTADVERFLREQGGGQKAPQEINLAMILVAVPDGASAAEVAKLKARAEDIAAQARAGKDFGALAKEYSDANGHGADGGALGLRPATEYPALFTTATQSTPVDGIVGPIQSDAGFHILKVLQRKQGESEVKVQLTKVRHILLKVSPQQSEAVARERLLDIRHRIESGQATFGAMAREYSQDTASAEQGGELGWVPPGQFVPEFEQAMDNLQPGQISQPVVTRFGVHLIEVQDRRERVLTPEEQRDLARNVLRERKAQEEMAKFARDVRGRAYVEYREPPQP